MHAPREPLLCESKLSCDFWRGECTTFVIHELYRVISPKRPFANPYFTLVQLEVASPKQSEVVFVTITCKWMDDSYKKVHFETNKHWCNIIHQYHNLFDTRAVSHLTVSIKVVAFQKGPGGPGTVVKSSCFGPLMGTKLDPLRTSVIVKCRSPE